ncbi:uncharacterized protein LOC126725206 [Quercus robur]|uniref:uncharacterized protein LOC126725206 n=1 Tax=Quercus robur TaxID=38942 RepID=UPI002161F669|nr:uncharacterized protein LOC126725206 [Quercus robur]
MIYCNWCIWKNRNLLKFEGRGKAAKVLVKEVELLVEEFRSGNTKEKLPVVVRTQAWRPPREGWYKANVDGAVFKETNSCGVGVVIRNDQGQIMGAMSKRLNLPLGAVEVEAKAFEEGLRLAGDLGLNQVILEGDAQSITNALMGKSLPPSSIQRLIAGASRWKQWVQVWSASYVRRDGNGAAHVMAQNAKSISDCVVWVEDTPPMIQCQVHRDVLMLNQVSV